MKEAKICKRTGSTSRPPIENRTLRVTPGSGRPTHCVVSHALYVNSVQTPQKSKHLHERLQLHRRHLVDRPWPTSQACGSRRRRGGLLR